MLFASVYVAAEAEHDCIGEDCPICALVDQCEGILKSAGDGSVTVGLAIFLGVLITAAVSMTSQEVFLPTPITERVRLNW